MVSVLMAPASAQQISIPAPALPHPARLDRLDQRLLEIVRQEQVVQIWYLLNKVGDEEAPGDRAMARAVRLSLWDRLKRLLWLRLLWRHGRSAVSIETPPPRPASWRQPRRTRPIGRKPRATVRRSPGVEPVSTSMCQKGEQDCHIREPVGNEALGRGDLNLNAPVANQQPQTALDSCDTTTEARNPAFPTCSDSAENEHFETLENQLTVDSGSATAVQQTQSLAGPDQISESARALAHLPRRHKRWTGWLHAQHCWREQLVVLPGGEVAPLIWCSRGRVLLQNVYDLPVSEWLIWGALREHEVTLFKHPAAIALGRAKGGVREKKSEAKARAARINGSRPTRNGRRRGRPPRSTAQLAVSL